MKCPVCKTELVVWKQLRLETLSDHVFDPNGEQEIPLSDAYRCPSPFCCTNVGGKAGEMYEPRVFWNSNGDLYSNGTSKDIPFVDNNNAPFGSLNRRLNVEIYKKDENKHLLTIPCWPLKGWKVYKKYSYQSNENGDILKRRFHLEWITNEGIYHTWGYKMLIFCLKGTFREWYEIRKNHGNTFCRKSLEASIKQASWPRCEWWRKINARVAKLALKTT